MTSIQFTDIQYTQTSSDEDIRALAGLPTRISINPLQLRQPGIDYDDYDDPQARLPFSDRREFLCCDPHATVWLAFTRTDSGVVDHIGIESHPAAITGTQPWAEWRKVPTHTRQPFRTASNALYNLLDEQDIAEDLTVKDRLHLLHAARSCLLTSLESNMPFMGSRTSREGEIRVTNSSIESHMHGLDPHDHGRDFLARGRLFDAMWSDRKNPQTAVAAKSLKDPSRALILRQGSDRRSATLLSDLHLPDPVAFLAKPAISVQSTTKTHTDLCEELATTLWERWGEWAQNEEDARHFLLIVMTDLQENAIENFAYLSAVSSI